MAAERCGGGAGGELKLPTLYSGDILSRGRRVYLPDTNDPAVS